MAKLNVTIPAVDVMVDGKSYRKVDRKPQAGDIVKALERSTDIDSGAFYRVEADSDGDLFFRDNEGDERYRFGGRITYEVYEAITPVSAVTTAEITYDNAKYCKVERDARVGDIVVFPDAPCDFLTSGKPYLVNELDDADDAQITDDDGDNFDTCSEVFDVYEKVTEEGAQVYREEQKPLVREVKRKAAVGERIKIVAAENASGQYTNGTELTVASNNNLWGKAVRVAEFYQPVIYDKEYVVLEPINAEVKTEPARLTVGDYAKVICEDSLWNDAIKTDTIVKIDIDDKSNAPYYVKDAEGNGSWARANHLEPATEAEFLAQRKSAESVRLKVGDYAKILTKDGGILCGFNVGDIVQIVVNPHDPGDRHFRVCGSDGVNGYADKKHGLTPATPEEVTQAKAETQRKLAIGPFAVGGYAVVVDVRKSDCVASSIRNGDYVKVAVTEVDGPYALELVSHGEKAAYSFCNADALRQITEEEYNAATQPKPKFSAGDKVRINVPENVRTSSGRAGVKNSEIGTVERVSGNGGIIVNFPSYGSGWGGIAEELTLVTAEEAAAIEKEAQEVARWAKINRKVGEFKRGDIVEVTDASCLHSSTGIKNGDIVILGDNDEFDDMFRLLAPGVTNGNYAVTKRFKLVTPVEQRFDTQSAA